MNSPSSEDQKGRSAQAPGRHGLSEADEADHGGRHFEDTYSVRRRVGMVFQHFNLFPHMTVLREHDLRPRERPNKLPQERGRSPKCPGACWSGVGAARQGQRSIPATLSGGQKQRVGHRPHPGHGPGRAVLFDEPTTALDPEMVKEVLRGHPGPGPDRHDHGPGAPTRWGLPGRSPTAFVSWTRGSLSRTPPRTFFSPHPNPPARKNFWTKSSRQGQYPAPRAARRSRAGE